MQISSFLSRNILPPGLPGSAVFFHIVVKGTIFEKKVIENKMCFSILSTNFVRVAG
jgi:hypothetical protein